MRADPQIQAAYASLADLQVVIGHIEAELDAALGQAAALTTALTERDAALAARDEVIRQQADALTTRDLTIQEQSEAIDAMLVDLAARTAEIADLTAEIARLNARIAELEGDVDPPVLAMLVGASVQRRGTETWVRSLARFEETVGKPMQVVRRFDSDGPGTFAGTSAFADLEGRHRILSFKGQPTQGEIEALIATIPADGCRTYLASWHEPEDDMSGAVFQGRSTRLLAAVDASGRTDVYPSIILKSWSERDGDPTTTSADYFPADPSRWVLLLDPYFGRPENTYATQCGQTVALWRAAGGVRIGIAEFGVKATGQVAADQITGIARDAEADGCEVLTYFDSNVGDNAGAGWYLDLRGQAAIDAFAALLP